MNALLWKKCLMVKSNKISLILMFLLPIIYISLCRFLNVENNIIVAIFPFLTVVLYSILFYSVEEVAYLQLECWLFQQYIMQIIIWFHS
jgi:hypothetical protein